MQPSENFLKKLPSTHKLLSSLEDEFAEIKADILKKLINQHLEQARENPALLNLAEKSKDEIEIALRRRLSEALRALQRGTLQKVINATGVVLHTGLGRAPIAPSWMESLKEISAYCNLELDLASGKRGQRNDHLSYLLRLLTGAEDGFAVNNNAAAVMLMLNTLGYQKEVIISRGEMIEIGGSFRMPEVMKASGCILREIGSTNKTHLRDYEEAIHEQSGAILICHPSNYEVQGFTHKPALEEVVALAHDRGLPVIYDLGSGSMPETSHLAGGYEPEVNAIVRAGVDLISFSGDKLLGGPQAGIIVGKREYVQRCAQNHLLRALRLDKFMIKLLQQTLLQYFYKDSSQRILAHRALKASEQELKKRCENFLNSLQPEFRKFFQIETTPGRVGSGAYPLLPLPGAALRLQSEKIKASRFSKLMRLQEPPVITYIEDEQVVLDLRTVLPQDEPILKEKVEKTLKELLARE
ncbi:L-seryl-tRNA(Sec) selenium transferase [Caldithrix abyssi]